MEPTHRQADDFVADAPHQNPLDGSSLTVHKIKRMLTGLD